MPNLEVHYKPGIDKRINFDLLGPQLQSAIAEAYNKINQPENEIPDSCVLVRFIEASRYDCGIPGICFVIKCGKADMPKEKQMEFCDIFNKSEIYVSGRRTTVGDYLVEYNIYHDVEFFNTQSHGFCTNEDGIITSRF